jgi:hypothetical protein
MSWITHKLHRTHGQLFGRMAGESAIVRAGNVSSFAVAPHTTVGGRGTPRPLLRALEA